MHRTDPTNPDTDGDGLGDGEEAGALLSPAQGYQGLANPTRVDSDGDGIDDYTELADGTKALRADTDGDGLGDMAETETGSDPSSINPDGDTFLDDEEAARGSDPVAHTLNSHESLVALTGGYLFGDWQWGAEHVGQMSEHVQSSVEYLLGSTVAGVLLIGDVRDAGAQIARGDWGGAVLSLVGLVPGVGDVAATVAKVVQFAKRGAAFTRAAVSFVSRMRVERLARAASVESLVDALTAALRRLPDARTSVDLQVAGRVPQRASNGGATEDAIKGVESGRLRIGSSPAQHERLKKLIQDYCDREVRVNQWQVTGVAGNLRYAGKNRPDLQCLTTAGTWFYAEIDRASSNRGVAHAVRITVNELSDTTGSLRILLVTAG